MVREDPEFPWSLFGCENPPQLNMNETIPWQVLYNTFFKRNRSFGSIHRGVLLGGMRIGEVACVFYRMRNGPPDIQRAVMAFLTLLSCRRRIVRRVGIRP